MTDLEVNDKEVTMEDLEETFLSNCIKARCQLSNSELTCKVCTDKIVSEKSFCSAFDPPAVLRSRRIPGASHDLLEIVVFLLGRQRPSPNQELLRKTNRNSRTMQSTNAQLDMVAWKLDASDKELVVAGGNQELCVMNLLKSVTEVRNDYQNLRKELMEVQALQRELSDRLRRQLRQVHGKFARLRERLAAANAH